MSISYGTPKVKFCRCSFRFSASCWRWNRLLASGRIFEILGAQWLDASRITLNRIQLIFTFKFSSTLFYYMLIRKYHLELTSLKIRKVYRNHIFHYREFVSLIPKTKIIKICTLVNEISTSFQINRLN